MNTLHFYKWEDQFIDTFNTVDEGTIFMSFISISFFMGLLLGAAITMRLGI